MKSRSQSQLNLPPTEVLRSDHDAAPVRKPDHADQAVRNTDREAAEALASTIFSNALQAAGIEHGEAAYLLGVSASMVDKMCSPNERQAPSLIQLLLLPPQFHLALIRQLDEHFGLGRSVLAQVQQAVGTLALLVR